LARLVFAILAGIASAQPASIFSALREHPAIDYDKRAANDAVARLNQKLKSGEVKLKFDATRGFLDSVLDALHVPVESQMAVFSKTSLQQSMISPANPRLVYFNDSIAVAWVKGEPFVEIASQDPEQGVHFYTLTQAEWANEFIRREGLCLQCHESYGSLGVPGVLLRSVYPSANGRPVRTLGEFSADDRNPIEERWGGWFVSGEAVSKHMGNTVFSETGERRPIRSEIHSDVAALMVFGHQMRMMNLITKLGWEARVAAHDRNPFDSDAAAKETVDYMLFLEEPKLPGKISGSAGFEKKFASMGPRDSRGRSLRDLDLETRLMRYPCSYMIYSEAFDGLPAEAKSAVYRRIRRILSGEERSKLSAEDRKAVFEILSETKREFNPSN
jgi:hypothetical protein